MYKRPYKSTRKSTGQKYFDKLKARHDFLRAQQSSLANFKCEGCG